MTKLATKAMVEQFAKYMPKITTNKNGYEIRTKVLEMAQDNVWNDYHAKFAGWSTLVTKEGDEVVTTIEQCQMYLVLMLY